MKVFTVMSSDLARHANWSVSFHRWLQASQRGAPTEVADFMDWLSEKNISKKSVETVFRTAKSVEDATAKLAKLAGRGRPTGTGQPLTAAVAPVVPKLIDQFIKERETRLKREQANIDRMKSKFKANRVVEQLLA